MWRWLLLLALARAGVRAQSQSCPEHCDCTSAEDWQYDCMGENNTQLCMNTLYNTYVYVRCEGDEAPCLLLPHVAATADGQLPHVTVKRCSPAILPCVLEAAGARNVSTLMFSDPREELRPEHLAGINPETLLIFDAYSVREIPSAALAAMPALSSLRINEARALVVAPGALAAAPRLRYLELSADGVTALPAGVFRGLARLQRLYLWKNDIQTVQRDSFEGLDSLEELDLKGNSLRELPAGVFAAAPALRVLYLESNSFQRLGPGVFDGGHLENITIKDNKVNLTLESLTFANSSSLKGIILQYSGISRVPADLFRGSTGLTTLDLSYNSLEEVPVTLFRGLTKLKELDLSHNKILEVSNKLFLPLKGLVHLNLNKNNIQVLPDRLFAGLRNFRQFSIDDNQLHTISKEAFLGVDSLYDLSLADNRLTLKQEGYESFPEELPSPFQYLRNTRTLVLRGNLIDDIFVDWTNTLTQLTTLDLSYNIFTKLLSSNLQFLSDKNEVDLRHNNITAVIFDDIPPSGLTPGPADDDQRSRSVVLLDDNPIECDCRAFPLLVVARGGRAAPGLARLRLGAALCAAPPALRQRPLAALPAAALVCRLPPPHCPAPCACLLRPQAGALELACRRLPPALPAPAAFGLVALRLRLEDVSRLAALPPAVNALDLSGLGLRDLPPALSTHSHLRELDLRNNLLALVPDRIMRSNLTLYLSNNSLECSCESEEFVGGLVARGGVADLRDVACADGRRVTDVVVEDLCAARDAALVAGSAFAILVVLALAFALLVYRHHYRILVYLSSRGYLKWLLTERVLDSDKVYDVFVSFSHLDEAFVDDHLMPKLENEFKLKVCVHYRDWIVGDMIPLQVVRSVEQSRKTVIVLSKNFLDSTWAGMEFRTAHCLALKEGRARVVLVILDEQVIADHRLDRDLRAYLSTNTYLKRSDPQFWDRLRDALPPRERKFTFLSKFRKGEKVEKAGGGGGLDGQLNSDGQIVNAALEKIV